MPAGATANRGDHGRTFVLRLLALALRECLALLGVSDPASPLLDAHLCILEVGEGVGGLRSCGFELDPVVLVGCVLGAEPLLEGLDLALEPREFLPEAGVVVEQLTDPALARPNVCVAWHDRPIVGGPRSECVGGHAEPGLE